MERTFSTAQRAFAEAIGTALLVFIGAGSVPAILLLEGGTKAPFSGADLGFISMAFGLIVIAMVYTSLGFSEGLAAALRHVFLEYAELYAVKTA